MIVYPKIESWDEFYPNEIFIRMGEADEGDALFTVIKKANVGATIYFAFTENETVIQKKIGEIKNQSEMNAKLILIGYVGHNNSQG